MRIAFEEEWKSALCACEPCAIGNSGTKETPIVGAKKRDDRIGEQLSNKISLLPK